MRRASANSSSSTIAAALLLRLPRLPGLEQRQKIVELLEASSIGVTLSENYMLIPEQSTDALVVHHPQAKYFDV